jgi:hypothetical protein
MFCAFLCTFSLGICSWVPAYQDSPKLVEIVHLFSSATVKAYQPTVLASMLLLGCFGPWMSTGIIMYFYFMHSQEGGLNIHRVTGHVLWLLPHWMDSFRPYLNQTLCSLHPYENLEILCQRFSTRNHLRGVSTSDIAYALLCATTST